MKISSLSILMLLSVFLYGQEKTTITRSGFCFSLSAGISTVHLQYPTREISNQITGSFPNMKIGMMLNDKTALMLSLPGSVYSYSRSGRQRDRGFEGIVPTVQYWPTSRLWINAGLGLGMDAPAFYDIKDESERKFYFGGAALLSCGYEVWQGKRTAFDLQLRLHAGNSKQSEGIVTGISGELLFGFNLY